MNEETLTRAVERLYVSKMRLGIFDAPEHVPYNTIDYSVVDSKEQKAFNLEVAKKTLCLLKNENATLPLDKSKLKTVGVIGPNANNRKALIGNYEGTASEYITVLEGIQEYLGDDVRVRYSEGCHLFKNKVSGLGRENDRIAEVRAVCDESDVVIAVMGLDSGLEGEEGDQGNEFASGDKPNLELPGLQNTVLQAICESGKPVVLVLLSGSALAFPWAEEHVPAIVQAWYPGAQGGRAVAQMLFGEYAPEGKLPVTFYRTTEELPAFTDYNMKGRTYRYMEKEALYPFGYGISYTDFALKDVTISGAEIAKGGSLTVSATVENKGSYDGAETVQVYVKAKDVAGAPWFQLKGLKKVRVAKGAEVKVEITLKDEAFALYDTDANFVLNEGAYEVFVGTSQPDNRSVVLTGKKPQSFAVVCKKTEIL